MLKKHKLTPATVGTSWLVEGLKRAGKDLNREKLVAALEGRNNADLGGHHLSYDSNSRIGSRFVELTVLGAGGRVLK